MGNFNLVVDTSNFKPFDIAPYLQTMKDYGEAYNRAEEQMLKILEERGKYKLPETEDNSLYIETMNNYDKELDALAESFSRGMNLRNRTGLTNLRRKFVSDVMPIHNAIEAYNRDIDKILSFGPNVTVANRNNRKVSDYYGGLNPGLEYRDNKTILQVAAGTMLGLNNALMSSPDIAGSLAGQYYNIKLEGINGSEALGILLNSIPPELRTENDVENVSLLMLALDNVYGQFAFAEGTPENKLIWENVVTGAILGIQAPNYSLQANKAFRTAHERAMEANEETLAKLRIASTKASLNNDEGMFEDENGNWEFDPDRYKERLATLNKGTSNNNNNSNAYPHIFEAPNTDKINVDGVDYGVIYTGKKTTTLSKIDDADENWVIVLSNNKPVTDALTRKYIKSQYVNNSVPKDSFNLNGFGNTISNGSYNPKEGKGSTISGGKVRK